jgi:hypothetical protein
MDISMARRPRGNQTSIDQRRHVEVRVVQRVVRFVGVLIIAVVVAVIVPSGQGVDVIRVPNVFRVVCAVLFQHLPLVAVVKIVAVRFDPPTETVILIIGNGRHAVFDFDEPVPGVVGGRVRLGRGGRLRDGRHVAGAVVDWGLPGGAGGFGYVGCFVDRV